MELLKTILLYLSMLFVSSVQIAPDPATVNITPTPLPTPYGIVYTATPVPTPTPTTVPTPSITANPAYGQMVLGDRDDEVAKLQQRLTELGYYTGDIDGAYGNQTRHAVELFQYQNGLTVDGIAGRYTQTVLYESDDVVAAPPEIIVTATPVFHLDATMTPPPATQTPTPTPAETAEPVEEVTVPPTAEASEEPTAAPTIAASEEPTAVPTQEATAEPDTSAAMLMDGYRFVLAGFTDALTVQDTDIVLHPVELDEILYVPLTEILKNAGGVVIENAEDSKRETAFSVLADFYQVSYSVGDDGTVADLVWEKNAQPQPMVTRSAVALDGVFYLPLEDVQRITGITFTMDDTAGTMTVTMP